MQTPQGDFRPHILAVLRAHGGSATVDLVIAEVYERSHDALGPEDFELVDKGEERWRNAIRWERNEMARDGIILRGTKRGVWQLNSPYR